MDWQILGTAIAAYAAGVATVGVVLTARRSASDRKPHLQVVVDVVDIDRDIVTWSALAFQVINHSSFPVTVTEGGFITADGTTTQGLPDLGVIGRIDARESTHDYVDNGLVQAYELDEPSAAFVRLATGEPFFSYVFQAWVEGDGNISLSNQGTVSRKVAKEMADRI